MSACIFCGSDRPAQRSTEGARTIVRCPECSTVFQMSEPVTFPLNFQPAETFCSCGCGAVVMRGTEAQGVLEEQRVCDVDGAIRYIELFLPGHGPRPRPEPLRDPY